jgi:hypothetical protein
MSGLFGKSMVALSGVLIASSVAARQPSAHSFPSPVSLYSQSQYAGSAACKDCHAAQYEAWEKTKHSKALSKLPAADRAGGKCIKCHVTGTPEQIRKPISLFRRQCEACRRGPGHIDAARPATT